MDEIIEYLNIINLYNTPPKSSNNQVMQTSNSYTSIHSTN